MRLQPVYVKYTQASKVLNFCSGNGYEFFCFGVQITTSGKIKDYLVVLVACLVSSDPRLWGQVRRHGKVTGTHCNGYEWNI